MVLPLPVFDIILVFIIITIGSILQGSIGFGLGPFCVPLLLLINPVFIPGPLLMAALLLTIIMLKRENHEVIFREVKWAVIGRVVGSIVGVLILTIISGKYLSLLFASVILFSLIIFISGVRLKISNKNLIFVGIISGFMSTTASIGGPPMGLLYQDKKGPKIRGTLSAVFMTGTVIALISLIIINRFGLNELLFAVLLMPGIIIGFYFSRYTSKFMDKGYIRTTILTISALTSLILILRFCLE